jgi:hypothetical protein
LPQQQQTRKPACDGLVAMTPTWQRHATPHQEWSKT